MRASPQPSLDDQQQQTQYVPLARPYLIHIEQQHARKRSFCLKLLPGVETTAPQKRNENSILTERELEVLKAASRGERSKEIALHLGIAERTVMAHLDSVYNKLGRDSRAAALATAIERGILAD